MAEQALVASRAMDPLAAAALARLAVGGAPAVPHLPKRARSCHPRRERPVFASCEESVQHFPAGLHPW